jgi:phosphomannomutase
MLIISYFVIVIELIDFELEDVSFIDEGTHKTLRLPELTNEERFLIDPIVAPTSGLRIQILDQIEKKGKKKLVLTNKKLFLLLRVFKAISQQYKKMKEGKNLKILIVTDNRPTRGILLEYCSQIFAYDGYEVYHQEDLPGESQASSPYGAASVALLEDINLIIVLTASHNELSWNGIKFYIDYPMPMSGDLFKEISNKALDFKEIKFDPKYKPIPIDAENKNNDYVISLISKVLEIKTIKNKKIVIWPYLGKARGIVNLFKRLGANVILIDEEINPPNPIKVVREDRLKHVMKSEGSDIAILLDADRDRIALYVKHNGEYNYYIPNEIYSALHNILANTYQKKIINVRTIPSDLRGDNTSFINILTGVGYKHLGVILYFLLGTSVDKSKVDKAILYFEDENNILRKIDNAEPLKRRLFELMQNNELFEEDFLIVMWEESGGHTLNVLNTVGANKFDGFHFESKFPIIADKYPVPALVLITELIARGHQISKSIDWSIKGINRTIHAVDKEKIKIMKNFAKNDNKTISIKDKEYRVSALSDNLSNIDIFQLKSKDSTIYFRPSGTGPEVRFYIFGDRETHLEELKTVQNYIKLHYS